MNRSGRTPARIVVLLLAAAFLFVSALISTGIFEGIPHVEDEAAYWFQAQVFATGRISVPVPPESDAYWSPFVIAYEGQRFGKYPPGFPLLLSAGVLAGIPWLVNASLGAATLVLLAGAGSRMGSPLAGLLAAVLGLSCPVFLAHAGSLLSHSTAVFCVAVLLWCLAGNWMRFVPATHGSDERPPVGARRGVTMLLPAAGAGLAIGYLALTRPFDALAIGGGVAICWLAAVLKGHDQYLFRAGVIGAVSAGLVALLLPIYWRAVTGEWMVNPYLEVYPYDHPGFGPHVGPRGFFPKDALTYTGSNLLAMAHSFLGWPAYLSLIFVPVPILAGPRADRPFLLPVLICSVILVYGTYWYYGGCDAGFPRYYTAALPCLLLLSGRGIELVAQWLRAHGGVRLPTLTLYPLLVLLVAFNAFTFLPGQLVGFRGKYGVTAAGVKAIQAARVEPALVLVTEVDEWNDFAPFFAANSPSLDSEIVYAIYRDARQAGRLRALFPGRACFLWAGSRLIPCAPDLDAGLSVGCRVGQGCS